MPYSRRADSWVGARTMSPHMPGAGKGGVQPGRLASSMSPGVVRRTHHGRVADVHEIALHGHRVIGPEDLELPGGAGNGRQVLGIVGHGGPVQGPGRPGHQAQADGPQAGHQPPRQFKRFFISMPPLALDRASDLFSGLSREKGLSRAMRVWWVWRSPVRAIYRIDRVILVSNIQIHK